MQDSVSLLVPVYKPVGKTPLECVEEYKSKHRLDPSITVSYAGRLDPMAEGVLLLLVGDANKKRREYEHLNKEYEVTVLVGFATDTGDLMGKLINEQFSIFNFQKIGLRREQLKEALNSFIGAIEQRYPIYSSVRVRGKPLYWWARKGRLNEIEIPSHMVQIDSIEVISSNPVIPKVISSFPTAIGNPLIKVLDPRIPPEAGEASLEDDTITNEALLQYIVESVGSVKGDFRQEEIIKKWKNLLSMSTSSLRERNEVTDEAIPSDSGERLPRRSAPRNDKNSDLQSLNPLFTLRITCGSGTYMRQLVADIGDRLGIPLVAFKIKRMRVGKYAMRDCARNEIASSLDNSSQ